MTPMPDEAPRPDEAPDPEASNYQAALPPADPEATHYSASPALRTRIALRGIFRIG